MRMKCSIKKHLIMRIKILHAEDDLMFSHIVRNLLEKNGFQVYSAADGATAWALFLKEKPDICLLDIVLPGISGIDLGEMIRRMNKQVPIFYLSAEHPELVDKEIYERGGATGFFSKTRRISELSEWLNNLNNKKSHSNGRSFSAWGFNVLCGQKIACV